MKYFVLLEGYCFQWSACGFVICSKNVWRIKIELWSGRLTQVSIVHQVWVWRGGEGLIPFLDTKLGCFPLLWGIMFQWTHSEWGLVNSCLLTCLEFLAQHVAIICLRILTVQNIAPRKYYSFQPLIHVSVWRYWIILLEYLFATQICPQFAVIGTENRILTFFMKS